MQLVLKRQNDALFDKKNAPYSSHRRILCFSWSYRFFNFTYVTCLIGLLLFALSLLAAFFLPITLSWSSARSHIPAGETLIVLHSETSFCFIRLLPSLPPSLSFSLVLSISVQLIICAFERSICACQLFARANFEPDSLRALEKEARRVGRVRPNGARAER